MNELKNFLKSDLTEDEYFDCTKSELISLKEYLLELDNLEAKYKQECSGIINNIKAKCPWVEDVYYAGDYVHHLICNDGDVVSFIYDSQDKQYVPLDFYKLPLPKIKTFNKKIKNHLERYKSVELIHEELAELSVKSAEIFEKWLYLDSVSGKFLVRYEPFIRCYLMNKDNLKRLIDIMRTKDKRFYHGRDIFNSQEKEKMLAKVMLTKK